ncbi:ABC transporter permease subunit [bacterium]|jgi:His/Glu/Gln/Arg/opine family amino acid ABC transporter permease subunit|nr:ABC transporter permease subunit [bacterium]MBT3581479.1 ABC transporter permease subunit [bacterium]MBT4551487.1 ABC transporter permease subunit [bacterium]MBT5989053.1 ABC transporter permease subunit [bacterium]MBT7088816.1 ABC transporter permease subunit [bacterium]
MKKICELLKIKNIKICKLVFVLIIFLLSFPLLLQLVKLFPDFTGGIKIVFSLLNNYLAAFISGVIYTVVISFLSILLGTILGAILALLIANSRPNTKSKKFLTFFLNVYIYSFLAIPALCLIIILYYNNYISHLSSITTSVIALGINLSPFAAKIIAAGIRNIDPVYLDAAKTFGYSHTQIIFKFKFPMIMRNSLQQLLVQWFTTIKLSSLTSVIGVGEILHRSQQVIRETYQVEATYVIMVLCYMVVVIPIAIIADYYHNTTNYTSNGK